MISPEFEKLLERLNDTYKKEGGGILGLAGISRLDYFAANAPPASDAWIEERCKEQGDTGVAARAAWAWEYARHMIALKSTLVAPAAEGMYVVLSTGSSKVYARASTPEKARALLEEVAQKEMTNATSFFVDGPRECPNCGHGSPAPGACPPPTEALTTTACPTCAIKVQYRPVATAVYCPNCGTQVYPEVLTPPK